MYIKVDALIGNRKRPEKIQFISFAKITGTLVSVNSECHNQVTQTEKICKKMSLCIDLAFISKLFI